MAQPIEKRPAGERPVGKRLIIGCDGTWDNSDAGTEKSWTGNVTLQIPSDVTRLIRAIAPISSTGTLQVAYYQRGVGSDGDLENSLLGGLTADDMTEKIREAYGFICNNYGPREQKDIDDDTKARDEIVLLGFSRGAFTARAISSLIHDVGLLTKVGLESFYGIVEDWKNQNMPGKEWQWFQSKYGKVDKKTFGWPQYKDALAKAGLTRTRVPIKAVGVFETVGALGIPRPYTSKIQEFSFVNTKVAQSIQYAFHALGLDEHRGLFTPTLWEAPSEPNNLVKMKQCWFPGVHSNIGGGYADAGVSNITLAWMISQLEENKILEFDTAYEGFVLDLNKEYYKKQPPPRSWGLGRIYDSAGSIGGMLEDLPKGAIARTPGNYHRVDDQTGKETNIPLQNTHEYIHRSVRVRIQEHGLGAEDDPSKPNTFKDIANGIEKLIGLKKDPEPYAQQVFRDKLAPLKDFEMIWPQGIPKGGDPEVSNLGYSGFFWKDTVKGKERVLPEDEFLATERMYLLALGGK